MKFNSACWSIFFHTIYFQHTQISVVTYNLNQMYQGTKMRQFMNTAIFFFLEQKTKKNGTKKKEKKEKEKNKKVKKLPEIYINLINKGLRSET